MNTFLSLRRAPLLALVLLAAAGRRHAAPPPAADPVLPRIPGTIALYPFNETTGTRAEDASGLPVRGLLQGDVERVPGQFGGAFRFASAENLVWIPAGEVSQEWTIQAWCRFPLETTENGYRTLAGSREGGHVSVNSDGYLGVLNPSAPNSFEPCDPRFNVNELADWHLVSATARDGSTTFYIDQDEVGVSEAAIPLPVECIGNSPGRGENWGAIDALRILSDVIPGDEIAGAPLDEPLGIVEGKTEALYAFEEAAGDTTLDAASTAFHGTITGGVVREPGLAGSALTFATPDARLRLVAPVEPTDSWTIQAWTRFPLPGEGSWGRTLAANDDEQHVMINPTGELGCISGIFQGSGRNVAGLAGWHLVSAVGSGSHTTFYIDDESVGVAAGKATMPVRYVGNSRDLARAWGTIDGIRILDRERSAADIATDAFPALADPAGLGQSDLAGATVAPGSEVHDGFSVHATIGDLRRDPWQLQLELKPAGTGFDGSTGLVTGDTTVVIRGIGAGEYHWQVRGLGSGGRTTRWIPYGSSPDIRFRNAAPVGEDAYQRRQDGTEILPGQPVQDTETVRFQVLATDPDAGDHLRLQVEVIPFGSSFERRASAEGPDDGSLSCDVRLGSGGHAWSYRVLDHLGGASEWTAFRAGAATPDIEVSASGSMGRRHCGFGNGSTPGVLLALIAAAVLSAKRSG